jgi:hypothetical protein
MKLTKNLKSKIDRYFENISAKELYKILTNKFHFPNTDKEVALKSK